MEFIFLFAWFTYKRLNVIETTIFKININVEYPIKKYIDILSGIKYDPIVNPIAINKNNNPSKYIFLYK